MAPSMSSLRTAYLEPRACRAKRVLRPSSSPVLRQRGRLEATTLKRKSKRKSKRRPRDNRLCPQPKCKGRHRSKNWGIVSSSCGHGKIVGLSGAYLKSEAGLEGVWGFGGVLPFSPTI